MLNLDDGSLEEALLDNLDFEADIVWADDQSHSTVYYHLESPAIRARDLVEGSDELDFVLHEADAIREDLGQSLSVDRWTLAYSENGRGLTGVIEFSVDGGHFDYAGRFTFDESR